MKEKNMAVPESYIVKSNEEVHALNAKLSEQMEHSPDEDHYKYDFILKNIQYDPVHRLDCFRLPTTKGKLQKYLDKIADDGNAIDGKHPWTVQRFIDGEMWSGLHIQIDGKICLSTCTKSKASCFNWEHEENDQIKQWSEKFSKEFPFNGIFTNDFIIDKHDGVAYAIECNPRLGSQVSLFHQVDNMADVILGHNSDGVI